MPQDKNHYVFLKIKLTKSKYIPQDKILNWKMKETGILQSIFLNILLRISLVDKKVEPAKDFMDWNSSAVQTTFGSWFLLFPFKLPRGSSTTRKDCADSHHIGRFNSVFHPLITPRRKPKCPKCHRYISQKVRSDNDWGPQRCECEIRPRRSHHHCPSLKGFWKISFLFFFSESKFWFIFCKFVN